MKITSQDLLRINRIIEEKKFNENRADALYKTFKNLKSEEQCSLFLDLLDRFLYIPLSHYPMELIKVTNLMLNEIEAQNFYIYNGLPLTEQGKIKSNYLISYQFKGAFLRYYIDDNSRKFHVKDSLEDLLKKKDYNDTALILVDDFIGSGLTIETAISDLREKIDFHAKRLTKLAVLCIAAMKEAVERIALSGVKVYCNYILDKGISDHYTGEDLIKYREVMIEISKSLNVKKNCYLGYDNSEALVCMERCPNNTFPVFYQSDTPVYARR